MTTARPELPYPCTFMLFTGQVYGQYFSVGYERTSKHVFPNIETKFGTNFPEGWML